MGKRKEVEIIEGDSERGSGVKDTKKKELPNR